MALAFNIPSQIVVQTAAAWAADSTVYSAKRLLITSDEFWDGTNQCKFKIANGSSAWSALVYPPFVTTGGATFLGAINEKKGSDIASASTTDIGAATGNYIHVTGTTTITALGTIQAGTRRIVEFDGALTLTHNATSLILPTGANITTAAGDVASFISEGSGNWRCVNYMKADGKSLTPTLKKSQTIVFSHSSLAISDGLTYFFAVSGSTATTATGALRRKFSMINGYIYEIVCHIAVATTLGSNEQTTIKLNNKTQGTSVTITTVAQYDTVSQTYTLTLSTPFAISKWDSLEIEVSPQTYATNPAGVFHYVEALAMES
jgi:hypothetical protein